MKVFPSNTPKVFFLNFYNKIYEVISLLTTEYNPSLCLYKVQEIKITSVCLQK